MIRWWRRLVFLGVVPGMAWAAAAAGPRWMLQNERVAVALGAAERGALVSLTYPAGREWIAPQPAPQLFALTFSRRATPPGERFTLSSRDARGCTADWQRLGAAQALTLHYAGLGGWPVRVTCTATLPDGEAQVRWRLRVEVPEGLVLEALRFPIVTLQTPALDATADDALVLGGTKGGVLRRLGAMSRGAAVVVGQPGSLAAQFGCYYTPESGVYTAAYDGGGEPKQLSATRTAHGLELSWQRSTHATGVVTQDYDVVVAPLVGSAAAPVDWRDAADLYKAWALTQPWCATPYARRTDVPGWMQQGPAMVRFGRDWLADPARIERWLAEYWRQKFSGPPLLVALWGWEKVGTWVTPDYFPVFPSDAAFTGLVAKLRAAGAHAFPWPSGYHWTLTYRKRPDGSFEWDDRARFATVGQAHAVQTRAGGRYLRTPSWLAGGDTTCLCGGDPWTQRWWNEEICGPLARRGCELIQVDQVVGGNFPACYDPTHPHPTGPGRWQTEAFARQLTTMRAAMKEYQPDPLVCFEEPNEWFNHLVGIQDYRDTESPHEWASVFNYLYHEYLPTFQSNPRADDLVAMAHGLVDGQMPHLVPAARDLNEPLPLNGGFEPRGASRLALSGWDQVHAYQGVTWAGRAVSDAAVKHSGEASLRLENAQPTDIVQIAQNILIGAEPTGTPPRRYRLSGWLKTEHLAKSNAVRFGLFGPGMKALGQGGQLPFPAAEKGWQRVAAEFSLPPGAETLRLMIHVEGPARAWVDDLALEELLADGRTRPARFGGERVADRLMRRWVELYHGEGRPWLQFGRMLHPPALEGATVLYAAPHRQDGKPARTERKVPVVWHNALQAPDGREAVVLANATAAAQTVRLRWQGRTQELTLAAGEARLVWPLASAGTAP